MKYLLDTSFCIDFIRGQGWARAALAKVNAQDVAVSAITVGELLLGVHFRPRHKRKMDKEQIQDFLRPLRVLDFDSTVADHWALIQATLQKGGNLIGTEDAMIAATARAHGAVVVTENLKHFERVKDLKVVNWATKPPKGISAR